MRLPAPSRWGGRSHVVTVWCGGRARLPGVKGRRGERSTGRSVRRGRWVDAVSETPFNQKRSRRWPGLMQVDHDRSGATPRGSRSELRRATDDQGANLARGKFDHEVRRVSERLRGSERLRLWPIGARRGAVDVAESVAAAVQA